LLLFRLTSSPFSPHQTKKQDSSRSMQSVLGREGKKKVWTRLTSDGAPYVLEQPGRGDWWGESGDHRSQHSAHRERKGKREAPLAPKQTQLFLAAAACPWIQSSFHPHASPSGDATTTPHIQIKSIEMEHKELYLPTELGKLLYRIKNTDRE
jgi:hypothetical protein